MCQISYQVFPLTEVQWGEIGDSDKYYSTIFTVTSINFTQKTVLIIQIRIFYLFLTEVPVSKPVTTSCTHIWWSVSYVNLAILQSPSSQSNTKQVFLWGDFADVIKVLNQVILRKGDYPRLSVWASFIHWKALRAKPKLPWRRDSTVDGSFTPCPGVPACPAWWHTLRISDLPGQHPESPEIIPCN